MQIRHPITRLVYERLEDGTVRVSDSEGKFGIFDKTGSWIVGVRKSADPLLCVWVATRPRPDVRSAAEH